jgi:hypothetical protein
MQQSTVDWLARDDPRWRGRLRVSLTEHGTPTDTFEAI